MFKLEGIDHVALTVRDVARSVEWYKDVLGLEQTYEDRWDGVPAFIGIGGTWLALFPGKGSELKPPPGRDTIAMCHLAFRATSSTFEKAQEELKQRGIAFEFQDHEIAHSIYFHDPDGHEIEITTYELNA